MSCMKVSKDTLEKMWFIKCRNVTEHIAESVVQCLPHCFLKKQCE